MSDSKFDLRKDFLQKRESLNERERNQANSLIRQRLFQHVYWKRSTIILCYLSFKSEVDTLALVQEAIRFKKHILVPLIDFAHPDFIQVSTLKRYGDLVEGRRGMLEIRPEAKEEVALGEIDLTLVPGLAFDRTGGRIGFGGGWFDRLFEKAPQSKRIGLAYQVQIAEAPLPSEPHDQPMDVLITEKEIISIQP